MEIFLLDIIVDVKSILELIADEAALAIPAATSSFKGLEALIQSLVLLCV